MAEAAVSEVKRLQERNCALTTRLEEKTLEVSKLTERIQGVDDTIDRHHRAQRRSSLDTTIVLNQPADSNAKSIDVSPQLLDDLRNDLIAMERRLELEQKRHIESSNVEAELRNRIILLETENLQLKKDKDLISVQLEDHQEAAVSLNVSSKMKMKRSSLPDQPTCDSMSIHDQAASSTKRSSLPTRLDDDGVSDEDKEGYSNNASKAKQILLDIVDDTRSMASRSMKNLYQRLAEEEKASSTTLATTRSASRTRSRSPMPTNNPSSKNHPWRDGAEKEHNDNVVSEDHQQESTCIEDVDSSVVPASLGQQWTAKLKDDEEAPSARRRNSERSLNGSTGRPGSSLGSIFEDDIYDDDDISLDINDHLHNISRKGARSSS